jgi:hypothetical protein
MLVMNGEVTGEEAWVMWRGMRAAQRAGARDEEEVIVAMRASLYRINQARKETWEALWVWW